MIGTRVGWQIPGAGYVMSVTIDKCDIRAVIYSIAILCLLHLQAVHAQSVGPNLPRRIEEDGKYLFYLHGGVVTNKGDGAINDAAPEWGPYRYTNILDSLRSRGFHVISERRLPNVDDSVYVNKVVAQIDTLRSAGVNTSSIVVVGASAGGHIALYVSGKTREVHVRFAILGACYSSIHKDYANVHLKGNFLSIIEKSDRHGTCAAMFNNRRNIKFKEIVLHTNLDHGFIYRGYKDWIDPIVNWLKTS